ncbi:hypothetical protein BZG36_00211 [Bifiguratus adelaidae]|uniref:MICOS complex subunit n=1 Tax=Bifiguratus adelaidae TaxID=1938954 RepID=A0A261Y8A7_9FUNG|nr:hypothetical protein BZG36_00211 [Bifiguratus adelaidae]
MASPPHENPTKKSIYDEPKPRLILTEQPTRMDELVARSEKFAKDTVAETQRQIQNATDVWIGIEHRVRDNIRQTVAPEETVLPGLLYVGVAGLAGTIIARRRNIFMRAPFSFALATATSYYFLPQTTSRVAHKVGIYESELEGRFPALKDARASGQQVWSQSRDAVSGALRLVKGGLNQTTEQIQESANGVKQSLQLQAREFAQQATAAEKSLEAQVGDLRDKAVATENEMDRRVADASDKIVKPQLDGKH